jgi:hypothetical protein
MRDLLHGNVHVNLYTYVNINILMDKWLVLRERVSCVMWWLYNGTIFFE